MASTVAMLGLLPAALSRGIGSETQKPLAIVVIRRGTGAGHPAPFAATGAAFTGLQKAATTRLAGLTARK